MLTRLTDRPFPPYAYLPGGPHPHPIRDPGGHLHGRHGEAVAPLDPDAWFTCVDWLYGIDLFDAGYLWEAHEVWEGLWHAAGRRGPVAEVLQALIQLAAAHIKTIQRMPRGVDLLSTRALEALRRVAGGEGPVFLGLELEAVAGAQAAWFRGWFEGARGVARPELRGEVVDLPGPE